MTSSELPEAWAQAADRYVVVVHLHRLRRVAECGAERGLACVRGEFDCDEEAGGFCCDGESVSAAEFS